MNVNDFITERLPGELEDPTPEAWEILLDYRQDTFLGFLRVEEANGGIQSNVSLSTKQGQESVRMLFARTLEEYFEARSSGTKQHFLEELIDALNYGMSILFLESRPTEMKKVAEALSTEFLKAQDSWDGHCVAWFADSDQVSLEVICKWEENLLGLAEESDLMLSSLRNRAWQESVQSPYFDGWPQLVAWVAVLALLIFELFDFDWDSFVQLFVAKDKVLQFRLRSAY